MTIATLRIAGRGPLLLLAAIAVGCEAQLSFDTAGGSANGVPSSGGSGSGISSQADAGDVDAGDPADSAESGEGGGGAGGAEGGGEGETDAADAGGGAVALQLDAIADLTVAEGSLVSLDAGILGGDVGPGGSAITYSCYFDLVADGIVGTLNACYGFSASFSVTTGVFEWTPDFTDGGVYEIRIAASDGAQSDDEIVVLTVAEGQIPTPGGITAVAGSEQVFLSWSPVFDARDYTVYWSTSSGQGLSGTQVTVGALTYVHAGLTAGTTYYYVVTANAPGTASVPSAEVSATALPRPSSTSARATAAAPGRKTFYDTVHGKHWAFYHDGDVVASAHSSNGVDWSKAAILPYDTDKFSVSYRVIGGMPQVFLIVEGTSGIEVHRGVLAAHSVAFDPAQRVFSGASATDRYSRPAIALDGDSYLWVASTHFDGATHRVWVRRSVNTGGGDLSAWGAATPLGRPSRAAADVAIVPRVGSDMYALISHGGVVTGHTYTAGAWSEAMTGGDYGWLNLAGGVGELGSGGGNAIAVSGADVYVGGAFAQAGANVMANGLARWDGSSWSSVGSGLPYWWSYPVIHAVAIVGTDVYIGGTFSNLAGNADISYIARWDGSSWNPVGKGADGAVRAIVASGTNLYVGGDFTCVANAGGCVLGTWRIARWDGASWSAMGAFSMNDAVHAIAVSGSDVYAAGNFTDAGGVGGADYVARWNGSAWAALGSGLNGTAYTIDASGASVVVGGDFTDADGLPDADRLAQWNGSVWSSLGAAGLTVSPSAVKIVGSDVYVGGNLADVAGNPANDYLVRWDGATWNPVGAPPGPVRGLAVAGADLLATGANFAARWNGAAWTSFKSPAADMTINALVVSGTDLYVGGNFQDAGGVAAADNIARWDGSTWNAVGSGLSGEVFALAVVGSTLYAGGGFLNAGGDANADFLAAWDGNSWSAVGGGAFNNPVRAIAYSATQGLFVGGDFFDAPPAAACDYIAVFNGAWVNPASLCGAIGAPVQAIAADGDDVYVGGMFQDANGIGAADYIARWNGAGGWSAMGSGLDGIVFAILVAGADVYAGGEFSAPSGGIARYSAGSWNAVGGGLAGLGGVHALAKLGTDIYFTGLFAGSAAARGRISYWNGTAILDSSYNTVQQPGNALAVMGGDLFMGGDGLFQRVSVVAKEAGSISAVADATGDVHALFDTIGGVSYRRHQANAWSAATGLATAGSSPVAAYDSVTDDVFAFFAQGGSLLYRTYDLSSWTGAAALQVGGVTLPSCAEQSAFGRTGCIWLEGAASSPFSLKGALTP